MQGSFDHREDHAYRQTDGDDDDRVFGDDVDLVMTMTLVDDDDFGDNDYFGDGDGLVMTHDHIWPNFLSGRVMSKPRPRPDFQLFVMNRHVQNLFEQDQETQKVFALI